VGNKAVDWNMKSYSWLILFSLTNTSAVEEEAEKNHLIKEQ